MEHEDKMKLLLIACLLACLIGVITFSSCSKPCFNSVRHDRSKFTAADFKRNKNLYKLLKLEHRKDGHYYVLARRYSITLKKLFECVPDTGGGYVVIP